MSGSYGMKKFTVQYIVRFAKIQINNAEYYETVTQALKQLFVNILVNFFLCEDLYFKATKQYSLFY